MNSNPFNIRETEGRIVFILAGALISLLAFSYALGQKVDRDNHSKPTRVAEKVFPAVAVEAKSAYVLDLRTGKPLFAKDPNLALPLASVTKLMSALVASDLSETKQTVSVSERAIENYGDSGLKVGERWRLQDLLDFSLITSSNDGIRAVALAVSSLENFIHKMNDKAKELGLGYTYFQNESGLDENSSEPAAYGSARDVANLMTYILKNKPELLEATKEEETTITSLDNRAHLAKNTNVLTGRVPGLLASKTGFTDLAGGNLAFAFDPEIGHPIVVVILGSSAEGRFQDANNLVEAVLDYLKQ